MEGECKQLEQLKKIIQKYYEKEDLKNFLKHIEKEFILKYRFRELYNIADLKKMTEEETKVFYEVMYVYAQKILKQLIIKYCKKDYEEKMLEALKNNFAIKYIVAEFPKYMVDEKILKEERKVFGEIISFYI